MSGDKLRAQPQPFGTASDYPPTNRDLASQIGALSAQMTGQVEGLRGEMRDRFTVVQSELLLLRTVAGDHTTRVTAVEGEVKEVSRSTLGTKALVVGGKALTVGKWITIATGVLGIATQIASMFRPDWVQPLQTLSQWVGGLQ